MSTIYPVRYDVWLVLLRMNPGDGSAPYTIAAVSSNGRDYTINGVDFTMGEYLPDLATVMPETKKYMWSDMVTMKRIGVDNHLTFSSGWEWGYWLTDWSIARWSWNYTEDGTLKKSHPLSILLDLFPDPDLQQSWEEALQLQKYYLKQLGLIPFLSALDPSSEFPRPFNKPFQPRGLRLHTDGFLRRPLMQR